MENLIMYVDGYNKAADFIQGTATEVAFVSTNSICEGESVGILWRHLFNKHITINFAYKTFIWDSEASIIAHVHCVIIGFSYGKGRKEKVIFDHDGKHVATNINGYLLDAPAVFIEARGKSLTKGMPKMTKGSQPTDDGGLILNEQEAKELIKRYDVCRLFIKRYVGAEEYINDKKRYCLWLKNVSPKLYEDIPEIIARIRHVAAFRMKSPTKSVRGDAKRPMLFTQDRQPDTDYLIVPQVSSSTRKYIPVGFISKEVIASNGVYIIPTSDIYMFGILTSSVHMDWMRVVSGRLKSDYRYSPAVYNNFPWPSANEHQKNKIVKTAQKIIEVRSKHTDSSFAEMYGQNMYLYADLVDAHEANDRAVMEAYGFDKNMSEPEIVAELMKMYQQLTEKQNN